MLLADFRASYPEFDDTDDQAIQAWLSVAAQRLGEDVWDHLLDQGTGLYVAHWLAMRKMAAKSADPAKVTSSESVGPISVGYDTSATIIDPKAGNWNATIYGQQFIQLARLVGRATVLHFYG